MIDNTIKAEWTNADALDLQPTYNQLATDCTKCNEYDNAEKTCPHYYEVRRSTEDGLQVETYCKKRKLPSAQSDSKESSFTHKALDLIERQAAIDLVRDVCNAVMSGCESLHDPETEDEVYEDIREVDAILKCNKEVRIALRNMPSAQQDCTECEEYDQTTHSCPKYCDVIRKTVEEVQQERKTGKWIVVDDGIISGKCSVCGWEAHMYEDDVMGMDYCPNCGERLEGEG